MSLNRIAVTMEEQLVADIAEHAAIYHSGNFDKACVELLSAGFKMLEYQTCVSIQRDASPWPTVYEFAHLVALAPPAPLPATAPDETPPGHLADLLSQAGFAPAPEPTAPDPVFPQPDPSPI